MIPNLLSKMLGLNTLAGRLFALSAIAALIGIAVVAYVISTNYRAGAEERLRNVLNANVYNLMGNVELDASKQLMGFPDLGDSRYLLSDSGWYWSVSQVGNPQNQLSSSSLSERAINVPESVTFDQTFQRYFDVDDVNGVALTGLETKVFLGEGSDLFSFKVTANKEIIESDIQQFLGMLFLTLGLFAFSLILAMSLLVRLGLQPINRATEQLGEIRKGEASRIEGEFPDEIKPLIDETNALIDSNNTIVERARTQVGNLAHSLKTPLAVMQNEIATLAKGKQKILAEQTGLMRQQVQVYLDRARISARSTTAIAYTPFAPELDKLISVVAKLSANTRIDSDLSGAQGVDFSGEKHDLQEIFGNLIENAAKYAQSQVRVTAHFRDEVITVSIEDNGPGMTQTEIEKAMHRGGRVDEGKTGWGLGLSIVTDIVDEYEGGFVLERSELGGLNATVRLPGRK